MSGDRVDGIRRAVELDPDNHMLRVVLAETLEQEDRVDEALEEYAALLEADRLPADRLVSVGELALDAGGLRLAARLLEAARRSGVVDGVAELQARLEAELRDEGVVQLRQGRGGPWVGPADVRDTGPRVTFAGVGGLDEVKKTIHRTIIQPFRRPELYERYGRRAGGGVMLFGPPGCGKTLLARATAGECELPFFNVRIEEIVDPYFGVSEVNLHSAFEHARARSPGVLFLDELDALAYARRKSQGGGRALVDQMLQELDAIGSDNRDLLILAATNAPWDVDEALKRPGRFDRVMFVPPPDVPARTRILELLLESRPTEGVDASRLAERTPLFSGADLRALVEGAVDGVIEEALDTGGEPPLEPRHVDRVLETMRPSTLDWLASARNYVDFANQSGGYDEVAAFLKTPEAKAWKRR